MGAVEAALEVGGSEGEGGGAYQRVVALKRLLPDSGRDARRVEMFLREARLAAMLDHPNVVRAYDYGEIDGELFLAMEYVEGQPLSHVLKALAEAGGEVGVSLTAYVLAEVCEGLHAAHELHDETGQSLALVHRDVSPQNVMLGYDGHVRLLDFGVAKIEAESVTKTGEVKGKTAYMSPEQAMGDAIDRRSDLFGVGAVLFECLALKRMWGDGTDMDVIRKLALELPPRLEIAVPGAPPELCALYTRLVARDAKERPTTAHDVATELRAFVPQGGEAAARSLRALLEKHFGAEAEEQHRRLTTSLEAVAPEQAQELRDSVSPDHPEHVAGLASTRSAVPRPSTASIAADATGANPTSDGTASGRGVAATSRESRWPWLAAAALAIGGVVAWRLATPSSTSPDTPPPPASVSSGPLPPASALASASAAASVLGSASASASASARAPALPLSTRTPAQPTPGSARPPTSATAPASASARSPIPSPTVSAKPPPDVDDHPF